MLMLMAFYEMNGKILSLQADTGAKSTRQPSAKQRSLKENSEKSPYASSAGCSLKQPPKVGKAEANLASTSSSKPGNFSLRPAVCPRNKKS